MRKTILLYIQVPFMDINIEYINLIKAGHDVHVLIELPQSQLHANIFNLDIDINRYKPITAFKDVAAEWDLTYLNEYFDGCASVNFVIYKTSSKLKNLYLTTTSVINFIKKLKIDYFHFDDFSARQFFILPFLKFNGKLIINIHDPQTHHGEFEWKRYLIKKLYYKKDNYYITFSDYSKKMLENNLDTSNVFVFRMLPYTVFSKFRSNNSGLPDNEKLITFIGRISPYKGIDLYLEAVEEVSAQFPEQNFFIGGRLFKGYDPDFKQFAAGNKKFMLIKRHLSNSEIADTIFKSKLVVCPYLEATQSGVVMTAYALNCPVLVTKTGGMAEYVLDNETGMISEEISKDALVARMISFLKHGSYEIMNKNLQNGVFINDLKEKNINLINKIYQ